MFAATVARCGWRCALVLLLLLPLMACGANDDGDRSTAVGEQATVIVATVEPTEEPVTASPTPPPPTVTPTATPPAPLAAQVNGQYIFLSDYERGVAQYERSLLDQGLDPESEDGQAQLAQVREDVLESLIDFALIDQAAAALGLGLSDLDLEIEVEAAIEDGGGQEAFEEWLEATGQTRRDFEEMLRQSILLQRVSEAVTADVPDVAEQVHARHIVVESAEAVEQILNLLQEGADFADLVRDYSLDIATKENGGDLGWFPRGLIAPELENEAFALQPGEYSDGILLGDGYHIIQVVAREMEHPLSSEVQVLLRQAGFGLWLEEQRAAATIERFVGE